MGNFLSHILRGFLWPALPASSSEYGADGAGPPPLYEAALAGDWVRVTEELDKNPETAKFVDRSGNTTLHLACRKCPPSDIVRHVLSKFPDAVVMRTPDWQTPLHLASYFAASSDVIEILIEEMERQRGNVQGAVIPEQDVIFPAKVGSRSVFLSILTLGVYRGRASTGTLESDTHSLLTAEEETEPLLRPDRRKRTPLHCAASAPRSHNRPGVVRQLLLNASNPKEFIIAEDAKGRTALQLVCDDYHEEIEEALQPEKDPEEIANSCLEGGGAMNELWEIMMTLLVALAYSNASAAKEWLVKAPSLYGDQASLQAVHSACKSSGNACPDLFVRLARKVVVADVDKSAIGTVRDLRARWENMSPSKV